MLGKAGDTNVNLRAAYGFVLQHLLKVFQKWIFLHVRGKSDFLTPFFFGLQGTSPLRPLLQL